MFYFSRTIKLVFTQRIEYSATTGVLLWHLKLQYILREKIFVIAKPFQELDGI